MEHIAIHAPRPRAAAPPDSLSAQAGSALARARYRAQAAIGDLDQRLGAADAAGRAGTWAPGAANTWDNFRLPGAAEEAVARHQRKRQRR
jgi:hypothetical protein